MNSNFDELKENDARNSNWKNFKIQQFKAFS